MNKRTMDAIDSVNKALDEAPDKIVTISIYDLVNKYSLDLMDVDDFVHYFCYFNDLYDVFIETKVIHMDTVIKIRRA